LASGGDDAALERRYGTLIGMRDGKPAGTPLAEVAGRMKPADTRLLELAHVMAM
jgi:hypothetical protein